MVVISNNETERILQHSAQPTGYSRTLSAKNNLNCKARLPLVYPGNILQSLRFDKH